MNQGRVKFFNENKGYGFIIPDDGGQDVFLHIRDIEASGIYDTLKPDQRLSYDLGTVKGKTVAKNIKLI